ncbi:hypothetical protein F4814DRAFT_420082 [Daldinia grandis]|nr:hypothetical protein F4814DRAFT_420082 [Daldinia grandis]
MIVNSLPPNLVDGIMNHFHSIHHDELQLVCTRCQQSKSECVRDSVNVPCQRCFHAKTTCESSYPTTSPPQTQVPSMQAGDQGLPIDTELSHMDVDLSDSNGVVNKQHLTANSSALSTHTPESSSSTAARLDSGRLDLIEDPSITEEPNLDLISLLERLSSLNIRLMRHLHTIPEANTTNALSQPGTPRFSIEETFHISQLFIDVTSHICSRLPPPQNSATGSTVGEKLPPFSLDASSELLLYSCYLRLIETYDRILRLVKASIAHRAPNCVIHYPFQMPDFTVGSFSVPSKLETRSIFLVNSMDAMMARAKELVAEVTSPKQTPGYRGGFQSFGGTSLVIVPDLAREAVQTRENALFDLVDDLKKFIVRSNS